MKEKILVYLCLFLVFSSGCGKKKSEQITAAHQKVQEAILNIDKSEYSTAERLLREAMSINLELKRDSTVGDILLLIAKCHRWNGNYDSILPVIENAMSFFRSSGKLKGIREGQIALANFYIDLGEYKNALLTALEAVTSARMFQDTSTQLEGLYIATVASKNVRQYSLALEYAGQIEKISPDLYKNIYQEKLSECMVDILTALGMEERLSTIINKLEEEGNIESLIKMYIRRGELFYNNSKLNDAVKFFSRALMLVDKNTENSIKIKLMTYLGLTSYRNNKYDIAKMYFSDALNVARDAGNRSMGTVLEAMIIACDWKYNDPLLRRYFKDFISRDSITIEECKSGNLWYGEMFGLVLMARLIEEIKDTTDITWIYERTNSLQKSLFLVDDHNFLEHEIVKVFLQGEMYACNTGLLQLSCKEEINTRIFELIEEQNLLDIKRFFSRLTFSTKNETLNNKIKAYKYQYLIVNMLYNDMMNEMMKGKSGNGERIERLRNLYNEKFNGLNILVRNVFDADKNIGYLLQETPPLLSTIQSILSEDDALLEFFRIRDTLYYMVVLKDTSYILKGQAGVSRILDHVREYNQLIGDYRAVGYLDQGQTTASVFRIDELSKILGNEILAPVFKFLDDVKILYFVTPSEYGILPLHTLRVYGDYLLEKYSVNYIPISTVLLMSHTEVGEIKKIVGIGYSGSTNWDVEYELRDIRSFFQDAQMVFNQDATLNMIGNVKADLIHLCAEFKLDTGYPDNTICVLSNGRSLDGSEYIGIGNLLTLSDTKVLFLDNISAESGVLTRYVPLMFLAGGTSEVIATMWHGDRKSKRAFNEYFYIGLKEGKNVSEAFQYTIKELINEPEFSKPQRWGLYYHSFIKR